MPHREIHVSAAILSDTQSQRLCLEDALAAKSASAKLHALQAVASARGPGRVAREVGLAPAALARLLSGEEDHDPELITGLVGLLLARFATADAGPESAKAERIRRAAGKTGPSGEP